MLNPAFLTSCWNQHQRGQRDWSALLWCVLMFRTWQEVVDSRMSGICAVWQKESSERHRRARCAAVNAGLAGRPASDRARSSRDGRWRGSPFRRGSPIAADLPQQSRAAGVRRRPAERARSCATRGGCHGTSARPAALLASLYERHGETFRRHAARRLLRHSVGSSSNAACSRRSTVRHQASGLVRRWQDRAGRLACRRRARGSRRPRGQSARHRERPELLRRTWPRNHLQGCSPAGAGHAAAASRSGRRGTTPYWDMRYGVGRDANEAASEPRAGVGASSDRWPSTARIRLANASARF